MRFKRYTHYRKSLSRENRTQQASNRYHIMIQDDIINELQYIPETKLRELYELIHSFRLRFNSENRNLAEQQALAGSLKEYTNGYIPTDQAIQQAWQAATDEKYHRS